MDLGLGVAGPMDDLYVVTPVVSPGQCIQIDERSTPYARAVTQLPLELVLKLGKRLGIPMDVFGWTRFDRDALKRILRDHTRGKAQTRENREKEWKSHRTTSDIRGKKDDSR
jgi:hypothetical protein